MRHPRLPQVKVYIRDQDGTPYNEHDLERKANGDVKCCIEPNEGQSYSITAKVDQHKNDFAALRMTIYIDGNIVACSNTRPGERYKHVTKVAEDFQYRNRLSLMRFRKAALGDNPDRVLSDSQFEKFGKIVIELRRLTAIGRKKRYFKPPSNSSVGPKLESPSSSVIFDERKFKKGKGLDVCASFDRIGDQEIKLRTSPSIDPDYRYEFDYISRRKSDIANEAVSGPAAREQGATLPESKQPAANTDTARTLASIPRSGVEEEGAEDDVVFLHAHTNNSTDRRAEAVVIDLSGDSDQEVVKNEDSWPKIAVLDVDFHDEVVKSEGPMVELPSQTQDRRDSADATIAWVDMEFA